MPAMKRLTPDDFDEPHRIIIIEDGRAGEIMNRRTRKPKYANSPKARKNVQDTKDTKDSRTTVTPEATAGVGPTTAIKGDVPDQTAASVEFFTSRGLSPVPEIINVDKFRDSLPRMNDTPESLARAIIDLEGIETVVKDALSVRRKTLAGILRKKIDQQTEVLDRVLAGDKRR